MSSIVAICNLALSNLGKENISSLSEASSEARACKQFYDHTRDILLQVYPWRFAGKTISLAEVANDKPGQWSHAYQRPNDCLKVRWVRPEYREGDPSLDWQDEISFPHDVDGDLIYCNLSPAFLRYTFQLSDPSRFSPLFTDALAWHLSVRLAMPLTRDPKIRADAWQVAQQMTGEAQMADANEVREGYWSRTDLVEGRG